MYKPVWLRTGSLRRKSKLLIHLSARNLMFKRLRSILTIMGVTIGVGSIFLLLSLGLGLQQLVRDRIVGSNSMNAVTVSPASSKIVRLDEESVSSLSQLPNVQSVGRTYSSASKLTLENATTDAVLYGVDEVALGLNNLQVTAGKNFDPTTEEEVIVNVALLEKIGISNPDEGVGKPISITIPSRDPDQVEPLVRTFTIVGVTSSTVGSEAFVSSQIFSALPDTFPAHIKLVADDQENVADIRVAAEAAGFSTTSPLDTLEQINQVFRIFNIILVGFGSIGMVIAVLGMFNTLTISLLERTREIGLMVALGARQRDMRRLFISEALLISVTGGAIGMLGSIVIGLGIDRIFNHISHGRGSGIQNFSLFAEPLWLIALGLLFTVALGYIVVYLPARRAASISPIDALRQE